MNERRVDARKETYRVLYATSEAHPLIKTGGLADVSGALPSALRRLGVDARILLPGYPQVLDAVPLRCVRRELPLLPGVDSARLLCGRMPDHETVLYVLDCPALYVRDGGPYSDSSGSDWADNGPRFAALSRAAALFGTEHGPLRWRAQIVHCNDWQTGLAPAYLAHTSARRCASVMSVHNMAFAGRFEAGALASLGLPPSSFNMHGLEFHGALSFLKAGLYYADHLTTVSETYAGEIQTPEYGAGMHGLLSGRRADLSGIMNGIDLETWSPARDPHLAKNYTQRNLADKSVNKRALQERCGLRSEPDTPLIGMVTRLTEQKGIDLLVPVIENLRQRPVQFAILGSGDAELERGLQRLAATYPDKVALSLGYDEPLAHQIEAGADLFLMPSRFEPCGLNQMYSMRYGTPPVVRRTGGLADSVTDLSARSLRDRSATGFVFDNSNVEGMQAGVRRALETYADKKRWRQLQRNGMRKDFSWNASAERYVEVYRKVLHKRVKPSPRPSPGGRGRTPHYIDGSPLPPAGEGQGEG